MTTSTDSPPHTTRVPLLIGGQLRCPRCMARLLLNYDVYTCVACAYEWEPAGDDRVPVEALHGGGR